ncbi:MAG: OmpA family protein [Verrucomicrobiales bacterium]|nr:OmpA family protein [Verrucomicrobiales bacterium]
MRHSTVLLCRVAALGFFLAASTQFSVMHAQIDRAFVSRALAEADHSDPKTRAEVRGAIAVYEALPKAVAGGNSVPAKPGHPLAKSPIVSDLARAKSEEVVIPMMTIFRGADHTKAAELRKSSEMFNKHMASLPVPDSLNAKYGHIKKCPACAAHVSHMIYQHEEAVASAPLRELVFFHTGKAELTETARTTIRQFAAEMKRHPDARVCLIGRASRVGPWRMNQELSERRSDGVAGALRINGVPADSITTLWLSFDEPQLTPRNSARYGFAKLCRYAGIQQMNQSVLMVLYLDSPKPGEPTDENDVVISPHRPFTRVDVSGFKSGDTVMDPVAKKPFLVP